MRLPLSKMLNVTLSACVVASAMAMASTASAAVSKFSLTDKSLTDSQPMGVTVDDLVRYAPARVRDAAILQKLIKSSDERIFQAGESLCNIPSVGKVDPSNKTICGNAYLEAAPHSEDGNVATYQLAILMETAQGPAFRKVSVEISTNGKVREVSNVQVQNDVLVSQTKFSISVGLVPNIQVLQDATNGLLLTSPIGNGGLSLDTGSTRHILTPMFHHAALKKSAVVPALNMDYYYRNDPYIAITMNGHVEPIAFHLTIMSDDQWAGGKNSEFLARGYQSHGCMRMRLHDLMVLYTIVTQSAGPIPVTVDYFASLMDESGQPLVGDESDPINAVQPYPVMHGGYQQVQNANEGKLDANGNPLPPASGLDTDPKIHRHEVVTEQKSGELPFAKLIGFDGDDQAALASYKAEMAKQVTGLAKKPVVKKKAAPAPADPAVPAPVEGTPQIVVPVVAQ